MEFEQVIRKRRMSREFDPAKQIPEKIITKLLRNAESDVLLSLVCVVWVSNCILISDTLFPVKFHFYWFNLFDVEV